MNYLKSVKVYTGLIIAMICWGLTFIWYKQLYPQYTPVTVVTLRLFLSILLLFPLTFLMKRLQAIDKKDIGKFFILALFEPFIYFLGESYGLKFISSTLASLIVAIVPLVVPVAGWFIFREKLRLSNYIGIVISVIGVILVIKADTGQYESNLKGIMLMMVAVLSTIGFSVYAKILSEKYNAFTLVAYQNLFGLIYFLPLFFVLDAKKFFMDFSFSGIHTLLPVVMLALFGSVIAFILFVNSIRILGISRANVFVNLIPVFTAIFAYFLLNEKFRIYKIVGIVIVISGVILAQIGTIMYNRKNGLK